ncbi:carboxymuconolactone decarboxylase family protein [Kineococcus sp. TBRC 1896]|uniref:Carboxymuconolactone decarboxylase family protein n=1 Tax=Kineococcus mangrovi TaxID=1660183 RepID=A0ABV4I0L3_9ACTN
MATVGAATAVVQTSGDGDAASAASASASATTTTSPATSPSADALEQVAPGLARYQREDLEEGLWARPGLAARDRHLVTLAHLVGSGQTQHLTTYLEDALDAGLTPAEVSETVTHLAFYSGWENAASAVGPLQEVFAARGVSAQDLPAASPDLLPLDQAAEAARAEQVQSTYGEVSQGVVDSTGEVLFRDLWLRPDLAPRDRSLVTVTALVSSGQVQQIPFHLGRAMDNGLTEAEVGETMHQLAFYAGWPKVFSAMPTVGEVLAARR